MNLNQTVEAVQKIAKIIEQNDLKVFSLQQLSNRLKKVAEEYRYDRVIQGVTDVISKKAKKDPYGVINAEQIGKIYADLSGLDPNSKFKVACADLLPVSLQAEASAPNISCYHMRDEVRNADIARRAKMEVDEFDVADDEIQMPAGLTPAFAKADSFERKISKFSSDVIDGAKLLITTSLKNIGVEKPEVRFKTSNNKCLLYTAAIDTFNGKQYVDVPVIADPVIYPVEIFAWKQTVYPLDKSGLEKFYQDVQSKTASSQEILANQIRQQIFGDTDGSKPEQVAMPKEFVDERGIDVESILNNAILRKESAYKEDVINIGFDLVKAQLDSCRYKNAQIKFAGDTETGLNYSATVQSGKGLINFEVPVDVINNQVQFPAVAKKGERVFELTSEGIQSLINASMEEGDVVPVKYSAMALDMTLNQLRQAIEQQTLKKNFAAVEEAFNVISDKYGSDALRQAMSDYQDFLTSINSNYEQRCAPCAYSQEAGKVHADHWCVRLNTACKKTVRLANGQCARITMGQDTKNDEQYSGVLTSNRIVF